MTNWYTVLEVSESASPEVLKVAWRHLQRRYHPDNKQTGNLEKSKQVNIAYDVLSDPDRRAAFDQELVRSRGGQAPGAQHAPGGTAWPGQGFPGQGFPGFNPDAYPGAYPGGFEIDLGDVARDVLIDASMEIGSAFLNNVMANMSPFMRKTFLDAIARRRAAQQRKPGTEKAG